MRKKIFGIGLVILAGLICSASIMALREGIPFSGKVDKIESGKGKGEIDTLVPPWEGPFSLCWKASYRIGYEAIQLTPAAQCSIISIAHAVGAYKASSKQCSVFVWSNVNGSPGAVLYKARVTATVTTDLKTDINWYDVNPPIYVADTFWVGNFEWDTLLPSTSLDGTMSYKSKYSSNGTSWNADIKEYMQAAIVRYTQTGAPEISASPTELILSIDTCSAKSLSFAPASLPHIMNEDEASYWKDVVPGEFIICYNNTVNAEKASLRTLGIAEKGVSLIPKKLGSNLVAVKVEGDGKTFIKNMKSKSNVKFVEPNRLCRIAGVPNDPYWSLQWDKIAINAVDAWDHGFGDTTISIGVVDEGADYTHPDLVARYGAVKGYDTRNNDSDPKNDLGTESHATHCSGIAAATINNGVGIAGVANARLYSLKYMSEYGVGGYVDFCEAIQWCIDNGVKILSMSTSGGYAGAAEIKCQAAWDAGMLLFAATGNDGIEATGDTLGYPAKYSSVIAVGAIQQSGDRWQYSNYGDHIKIVAPGVNITSTVPGTAYQAMNGTSMACPQAAGAAALIWAAKTGLTNAEVRDILLNTATDISPAGWDKYTGYGKINLDVALDSALNAKPTPADTGMITVYNGSSAAGNLYVTNISYSASWIKSVEPMFFTLAPGASQGVTVIARAKLSKGYYYDTLWIASNDPDNNPYPVQVTLRVGDVGIEDNSDFGMRVSEFGIKKDKICLAVAGAMNVDIKLYDLSGREKETIYTGVLSKGNYTFTPEIKMSGVYFVKLSTDNGSLSRKMVLIK
ncbi:MAG: S8 family peptidase [bacterium]|nr:S8 family peptidase [bacterium]